MTKPVSHSPQGKGTVSEYGNRLGRPSGYSDELAELICARIASGETLTAICNSKGMPHRQTVLRWRREHDGFNREYHLARVDAMDVLADQTLEISDDSTLDTVIKSDPKGRTFEAVDHENINRDRLRVQTRQFLMAKIAPHVYGDKVQHQHTGQVAHTVELSDRERMRRLASFMLADQRVLIDQRSESEQGVNGSPPDTAKPSAASIIAGNNEPDPPG
jgi:hypothetical protein